MTLISCPECKNEISSEAEACPKCGYSQKKHADRKQNVGCGTGCLVVIILFVIVGIIASLSDSGSNNSSSSAPRTPEERRKEAIEKHFSSWDGSHRGLTKVIKQSMNDPDSYEHVETTYGDKGDHLIVKTTFRGKNAFGGVVPNWIMAKVDLHGNVVEIISQGP